MAPPPWHLINVTAVLYLSFMCLTAVLTFAQEEEHGDDPVDIVAKALYCFNNKYIYSSCSESYRLTQSGDIHVTDEYTDQYCEGPCRSETDLVLNCIDGIMDHFLFYNRATTQDIRETIAAGCGYGDKRGDFNVDEHLGDYRGSWGTAAVIPAMSWMMMMMVMMIVVQIL